MTDIQTLREAIREAIGYSRLHDTSVRVNVPAAEDELVEAVRGVWLREWCYEDCAVGHGYDVTLVWDVCGWTDESPENGENWSITVKLRSRPAATDRSPNDKYTTEEES